MAPRMEIMQAVALVYNSDPHRHVLKLAISNDDGMSWHRQVLAKADPDSNESFEYPAITQTPDKLLHITFTHYPAKASGACPSKGPQLCQHIAEIEIMPDG